MFLAFLMWHPEGKIPGLLAEGTASITCLWWVYLHLKNPCAHTSVGVKHSSSFSAVRDFLFTVREWLVLVRHIQHIRWCAVSWITRSLTIRYSLKGDRSGLLSELTYKIKVQMKWRLSDGQWICTRSASFHLFLPLNKFNTLSDICLSMYYCAPNK